ncbi:hypothetical protein BDF14DRAFT_1771779 [Spinellus fusiger]|nr:hypothetical protein BDF14DRAFT_1771779 [Spinellus fusiger]
MDFLSLIFTSPSPSTVCSTLADISPRYIDQCVKLNPRQLIKVNIMGDTVELPVYTLRRRNALVHL